MMLKLGAVTNGGNKMKNNVEIKCDGNDVVVIVNKKEVFRKPKTKQTISIANDIYMRYKYDNKIT